MANMKSFDLNLLLALKSLVEERSVSRAAEKLFMSQPAMSHVLRRLRDQLDDPILVKTAAGMIPTPRRRTAGADDHGAERDRTDRSSARSVFACNEPPALCDRHERLHGVCASAQARGVHDRHRAQHRSACSAADHQTASCSARRRQHRSDNRVRRDFRARLADPIGSADQRRNRLPDANSNAGAPGDKITLEQFLGTGIC